MEEIFSFFRNSGVVLLFVIADFILLISLFQSRENLKGKFYTSFFYAAIIAGILGGSLQCYAFNSGAMFNYSENKSMFALLGLFSPAAFWFSLGIYSFIIEEKRLPEYRESVLALFLKSFFSLGLYIPFWHVKRSKQFATAGYARFVLIALSYVFFLLIMGRLRGNQFVEHDRDVNMLVLLLLEVLFIAFVWISLLSIRNGILDAGMDVNIIATLFLGPLYLQYKINQLEDYREGETEGVGQNEVGTQ